MEGYSAENCSVRSHSNCSYFPPLQRERAPSATSSAQPFLRAAFTEFAYYYYALSMIIAGCCPGCHQYPSRRQGYYRWLDLLSDHQTECAMLVLSRLGRHFFIGLMLLLFRSELSVCDPTIIRRVALTVLKVI